MANEINKKVDQIRTFFKKNQAANHPIKDHPISKCEEYVKGLYFDMLCVIAQYENEDIENQNKFIQRIMAGSGEAMPIAEHIKRAMSITPENMAEFIKQCRDNNLNEIFFIDALIISCGNGTPNQKQVEFLAEIADVLGFDKDKVNFLSQFVIAILEQDFEKLKTSVNDCELDTENVIKSTECYTNPIIEPKIINNDRKLHYFSLKLTDSPLFNENNFTEVYEIYNDSKINVVKISHKDEVIIENQFIDNTYLIFECVRKIKLIGCKFIGSSGSDEITEWEMVYSALQFNGVENVEIENCFFSDFNNSVFSFSKNCNVNIKNCLFQNISRSVISGTEIHITLESCKFENVNMDGNGSSAISYNSFTTAKNCIFENCGGYGLFKQRDEDGKFENNKLINCRKERYW